MKNNLIINNYLGVEIFRNPVPSDWNCYLFGNKPGVGGLTWRPLKGKEPNWFWRKMQWLILGNLWVKEPIK